MAEISGHTGERRNRVTSPGRFFLRLLFLGVVSFAVFSLCACSQFGGLTPEDYKRADDFMMQSQSQSFGPVKKEGGGKFRISYLDIDPYPPSGEMLYYMVERLRDTGWITLPEGLPFDPLDTDAKELIRWLSARDLGEYLEFPMDACYYLAVDGEDEARRSLEEHRKKQDIDLIFCMGTWPGQLVKDMGITDIPVMVYFCVDPVGAGLSETSRYSGQDNIWCHVNYMVYNKQLKFYHDSFDFDNIGMVYYDESVAAMGAYREVAKEEGFMITESVIEKLATTDESAVHAYYDRLRETFCGQVKQGVDAFMLGTDIIKDEGRIQELLTVFYDNHIPVFVQNGEYFVQQGAFMMVTASDAKDQAPFVTDTFSAILNGQKPGSLSQEYLSPPYLCLNLDAARLLGDDKNRDAGSQTAYELPADLLLSAERIYHDRGEDAQ